MGYHIWCQRVRKFQGTLRMQYRYGLREILEEIHAACLGKL